jgi:hypothetical protein
MQSKNNKEESKAWKVSHNKVKDDEINPLLKNKTSY